MERFAIEIGMLLRAYHVDPASLEESVEDLQGQYVPLIAELVRRLESAQRAIDYMARREGERQEAECGDWEYCSVHCPGGRLDQ